jgi:hemerythrin
VLLMALLEWTDSLHLGQSAMDDTHREFVELLNRFGAAGEADMPARLDEFIAHTEAHFGQEEAWMEALQFPPLGCHRTEHEGVLEIMREVRKRIAGGETHFGEVLAKAIAEWFPLHAGSMDTVLALYIQQAGFEPSASAAAQKENGAV